MNHLRQTQDAGTAQNIGIERKETEQETNNNGRRRENSDAVLFDPRVPKMNREQSKTDERNGVPVRSRDVIEREQERKSEHGKTKTKQKDNCELLVQPTQAAA